MIKNEEYFFDGIWNWDFLKPIFGDTGIMPMDIDGILEKNDWFLVIETKTNRALIPNGQSRTLRALVKRGGFTVLGIWTKGEAVDGKKSEDIEEIQYLLDGSTEWQRYEFETPEAAKDFVYKFVEAWYNDAKDINYYDTIRR